MTDATQTGRDAAPQRRGLAVAHRAFAVALPALVLVQATLAGQFLFSGDSITLHGILGNVSFAVAVVLVILAAARRLPATPFFLGVALAAMTFAQVGLGYVGRDSADAAAWHIPLGVAIFGTSCYQLALLTSRRE